MPLADRDAAHLWDMLDIAKEIHSMMRRHDLETFLSDRILQRALERCLEILGEAARRVTDEARRDMAEIPWKEIVGLRNIIAHEYGEIDHEILFSITTRDIPRLIASLVVAQPQLERAADNAAFELRSNEPEISFEQLNEMFRKDKR